LDSSCEIVTASIVKRKLASAGKIKRPAKQVFETMVALQSFQR
jgi:hypothetical protein